MNWIVEIEPRVYGDWLRARPSVQEQMAMVGWLKEREEHGAPSIVAYSTDGFPIAEGPNGEQVELTEIAKPVEFGIDPPYGIIAIRHIHPRP